MNYPASVLLIDDDPDDCEILVTAFKDFGEGVTCYCEQDAEAAIKRICDLTMPVPDMVFLDWRMPFISGAEILSIIKSQPHYNGIPVVIFTGGHAVYWEEAQKLGASYLLKKPYIMDDLIIDIKQIFDLEIIRNRDRK